jgi:type I restriction enzyme S subunit
MDLGDLCDLIVDCEHKTAPTQETGHPSIRTPNIGRGYFILTDVNRVSEETYKLWTRRAIPKPGDLIMAREAPAGNVAVIPPGLNPCLGQRTLLIRCNRAKADPYYLSYLLNGPQVQGTIYGMTNGATVPHLNMKDVRTLPIPEIPPLPTQHKIAATLSAYDDLIENNTRRIKILEEMAQALYREWFVHFRLPGHEKVKMVASPVGPIPQGWETGRLDDALILQRGFDLPIQNRRAGSVPVFAATGVVGTHDEARVKGPGIVTGRSGSLGTVIYVDRDFWPLNTTLWVKEFRRATPALAFFLLKDLKLDGFNSGAAVPTLNRNDIHGLPVNLAPNSILSRFDDCMLPMFALKKALQARNANLRRTRDLLLPKLISGEIDVSNLDTRM